MSDNVDKNALDTAIEDYGQAARSASKQTRTATLLGFGAVAAGGMFTASEADAAIVYSGPLNVGFNVSTVNASSTNAISPPIVFSSTAGAPAFGIAGNDRGPANPVGSTDILWAVGAGYAGVGGTGGVFANAPSFPATVLPQVSSNTVGSVGSAASLVWAAVGVPGNMAIDPFGVGNSGTTTGFFGFTFASTAAATLTGWARIQITSAGGLPTSMTLIDWAYETDGSAIHVGDTGGSQVPEPATAGLLALGLLAGGASGLRRRRKAKAA